ncbi:MAG: hypothetical protein JWN08_234 [Frankiales bacterium]|nr:hypothetical protein [Frankiales bacterium]
MLFRSRTLRVLSTTAAAALAVSLGAAAPASAKSGPASGTSPVLVTSEVLAPLHLVPGPGGKSLYVADAFPGTVVRVDLHERGATSTATVGTDLGFAPGVEVKGKRVYVVRTDEVGTGAEPEEQAPTYLSRVQRGGGPVDLVDLLGVERRLNPDGQRPDGDAESNPYDLVSYRGGFIVADAAGNSLIRVFANGDAGVLTRLPLITAGPRCSVEENQGKIGCDPVPTGVALGRDGYLYVSGLGAFAAGQLWKIDPRTGRIVQTLTTPTGNPPLTDVAVGDHGDLYVSSIVAGRVFRLSGGSWTSVALTAPAGLAFTRGTLYVGSAPAALLEGPPTGPPPPGGIYAVPSGAFS